LFVRNENCNSRRRCAEEHSESRIEEIIYRRDGHQFAVLVLRGTKQRSQPRITEEGCDILGIEKRHLERPTLSNTASCFVGDLIRRKRPAFSRIIFLRRRDDESWLNLALNVSRY